MLRTYHATKHFVQQPRRKKKRRKGESVPFSFYSVLMGIGHCASPFYAHSASAKPRLRILPQVYLLPAGGRKTAPPGAEDASKHREPLPSRKESEHASSIFFLQHTSLDAPFKTFKNAQPGLDAPLEGIKGVNATSSPCRSHAYGGGRRGLGGRSENWGWKAGPPHETHPHSRTKNLLLLKPQKNSPRKRRQQKGGTNMAGYSFQVVK